MSWQERQYDDGPGGGGMPPPYGRGGSSWFGGLPKAGKAVKYIAIANFAMFALCLLTGGQQSDIYKALAMNTPMVFKGQIWRLFTFTYLHDQLGLLHIGMNMLGLYFLGTPLEQHWGTKRFFVFYTLGGFAAVLLYVGVTAIEWLPPHGILIGASGNVLAVLGACAVLFPHFRLFFFFFPVPIRTATVIFIAIAAFSIFTRGDNAGGEACHLAGLIFGIAWGYRGHIWMHKVHELRSDIKRGALQARREEQQRVEDNVDKILDKVRREGIGSLTKSEKQLLEKAGKMQREADRRHGL